MSEEKMIALVECWGQREKEGIRSKKRIEIMFEILGIVSQCGQS